jgi:uncharacterized protein involved in tolerance to divalent cations
MSKCANCNDFFPPGFTELVDGTNDSLCLFCKRGVKSIPYKNGDITRETIVEEYKLAMKMIKEKNEIIRRAGKGIDPIELPESVRQI